jgi:type II secretory pathway pseudopilin PulG
MKNTSRKTLGITLVELLIAASILGVLLAALTGLFSSSANAMQTNKELSDKQQNAAVAEQVLKYELGLAGYRGVTQDALTNNKFSHDTLAVTRGSSTLSDEIQVRYYEDRLYGTETTATQNGLLRNVTFGVAQANGKNYLTRKECNANQCPGTTSAIPLVEGVTKLKILGYFTPAGKTTNISKIPPDLVGLELQLTFSNAPTKDVFISFQNPQTTSLTTQHSATGQ